MAEDKKTTGGHRFTLRLPETLFAQVQYWAAQKEVSINEFIEDAVMLSIRHQNGDYDLPRLEVQRLNQLVDGLAALSSNVSSLEDTVISGLRSLTELARGDNYLHDVDADD